LNLQLTALFMLNKQAQNLLLKSDVNPEKDLAGLVW
jgi:hypothetical protein